MKATLGKAVAGVTATLALLAACGDDGGEDADAMDPTEEASAPDATGNGEGEPDDDATPQSPEEEVLADYEAAIDALSAAFAVPDPEHPDLLDHWAGEALLHVQASLENFELNGEAAEGTIESSPVVTLDPQDEDGAWVDDCFVERAQKVDADTREPLSDMSHTTVSTRRRLERVDGTWKVTENESLEEDGCTPG